MKTAKFTLIQIYRIGEQLARVVTVLVSEPMNQTQVVLVPAQVLRTKKQHQVSVITHVSIIVDASVDGVTTPVVVNLQKFNKS